MNNVYLVCVEGSYLKNIENFTVSFTKEFMQANFYNYEEALKTVNDLIMLGYDASAILYNFQEIENPKDFKKNGLFVIKMADNKYWTWDYYGNFKSSDVIVKDSLLTSYKECKTRIKIQHLNGKAVQLVN